MKFIKAAVLSTFVVLVAFAGYNLATGDSLFAVGASPSCRESNIINCGVATESSMIAAYKANAAGDIPAVYGHYGITAQMVTSGSAVDGVVNRDGTVYVGNRLVATGASTVGRTGYPQSTSVTINGKVYKQHTTQISFEVPQVRAFVFLDARGQFIAAVLVSCGNPITAKPVIVPAPVFSCDSLTPAKITRETYDFALKYTAKNGATFKNYSINFGDGQSRTGLTTSPVRHSYANAGTYTVTTTVYFTADGVVKSATCATKVTVAPAPVYACDALKATKISRDTYDYTLAYTAKNGATLKNFDLNFGDGQTKTGLTASPVRHTYAKPGTYKTTATVRFNVGTAVQTVTCATTVTVSPAPVPGVSIEKTVNNVEFQTVKVGTPFTYELVVTNTGDVDLTNVVVTDTAPDGVKFTSADQGVITNNSYRYVIPGTLKIGASVKLVITAELTKYVEGAITNKACVDAKEVSGNPDDCDTAVIDTKEMIEVCDTTTSQIVTIKKDELGANHTTDKSKCALTTPPVVELPHTGAADLVGGGLGLGSLVGAVLAYGSSRRNLR